MAASASASAQRVRRKYPRFFPGARWAVAFGSYDGVERFAVDELQKLAQAAFPYVIDIEPSADVKPSEQEHLILIGTERDNPLIRSLIERGLLKRATRRQGYSIAALDSPWKKGQRIIALAGFDPNGVLYGVEDFNARIVKHALSRADFDSIPDFAVCEAPAIENRGIWCWGYVIYDYRRFLDHMARLKMNTLIFWNDTPPYNCRQVIEYAHNRGIRIVLGFQWGYDVADLDPTSAEQRRRMKDEVVRDFRQNYRGLGMDGIYFQTFTENSNLTIKGRTTAAWACDWVNEISAAIFKLEPKLRIEFGLHGSSIRGNFGDLRGLDSRVTITWEDAGSFPYTYDPVLPDPKDALSPDPYRSLLATVDYSKKLVGFRSNREFSMVAKGWIQLPWQTSEHHPPYVLGERDPEFVKNRLIQRQARWDFVNSLWSKNFPMAASFYRSVLSVRPAVCSVTGLIEDGMFEERIQPSVALFAQTLWNPSESDSTILLRSVSPYYSR